MTQDIEDLVIAVNELRTEVSQLRQMMTVLLELIVQVDGEDDLPLGQISGLTPPDWAPERGIGM